MIWNLNYIQTQLKEQVTCSKLMDVLDTLLKSVDLWRSLVEHHRMTFITLYDKCSYGKQKYLRFQIEWHTHCSVFLLPKQHAIECILHHENSSTINQIRQRWLTFTETFQFEDCNKLMVMVSSTIYDILLKRTHKQQSSDDPPIPLLPNVDGDDVYYRF